MATTNVLPFPSGTQTSFLDVDFDKAYTEPRDPEPPQRKVETDIKLTIDEIWEKQPAAQSFGGKDTNPITPDSPEGRALPRLPHELL